MMTRNDFGMKHCVYVFVLKGDKLSFSNDNIVVSDGEGNVKHQSTCYRVFALFIVGQITITSSLIDKSHKFGFPIYIMSPSFRTIDVIGHYTEGNTRLRELQYGYESLDIAKHIIANKIQNQRDNLELKRINDWKLKECKENLAKLRLAATEYSGDFRGLMGIEGTASRIYFEQNFDNVDWNGRKPRSKCDIVNSTLDIGYTILFNYVDAMLGMYGFDRYRGIFHREFYLRKSLVCDLVEPFRPLIDWQVRKALNLGQIKTDHFNISNGRYLLDIRHNKDYTKFLMEPLIQYKDEIFTYFQSYYRSFMKSLPADRFPDFRRE
ncbi:MAG: type V CRISPR-associated endonuclease Cas1 [Candidatus Methanomethylophilus sp.]|jgi:CRISPR-associated protein Cas1|nr:type V CRISPR-associated endonuclease Cas1 [Methanomethylophilus sp.]MCI2074825.1 type V CRISPR-associated endonuclease Cas1 [Methanomethylophilus sp.]MCI2093513.1 type V CRISPR-associated endonuclease Cas1 [Methanomethylophilus sp.]